MKGFIDYLKEDIQALQKTEEIENKIILSEEDIEIEEEFDIDIDDVDYILEELEPELEAFMHPIEEDDIEERRR